MRPHAARAGRVVADFLDTLGLEASPWCTATGAVGCSSPRTGTTARRPPSILPCEAFDNFPPGLPGKMVGIATRMPGGIQFACRQLRVGWLRRLPPLFGQMARHPVPDDLVRAWTEPLLSDPGIRRDLRAYCLSTFDKPELVRATEALRGFKGDALVLWSPDNRMMPPEHGPRLAGLLPAGRYAEVPGAYVLSMLDARKPSPTRSADSSPALPPSSRTRRRGHARRHRSGRAGGGPGVPPSGAPAAANSRRAACRDRPGTRCPGDPVRTETGAPRCAARHGTTEENHRSGSQGPFPVRCGITPHSPETPARLSQASLSDRLAQASPVRRPRQATPCQTPHAVRGQAAWRCAWCDHAVARRSGFGF